MDIVVAPENLQSFPGLYVQQFPPSPWFGAEEILVESVWRATKVILAININDGHVTRASPVNDASWTILDTANGMILALREEPNSKPELHVGRRENTGKMNWCRIETNSLRRSSKIYDVDRARVSKALSEMAWRVLRPDAKNTNLEVVICEPKTLAKKAHPLIVLPHGGPHSVFCLDYSNYVSHLVHRLGARIALVNYTGSLGYGEHSIRAILGKCGDTDVEETHLVARVLAADQYTDSSKVFLWGGSHGGFITAHLIGRYPVNFLAKRRTDFHCRHSIVELFCATQLSISVA